MNKRILLTSLLVVLFFFALLSNSYATTTYTPSTKTVCDENKLCTLTLYSGTRHVFEDGLWKPVEEARSLMNYFDVVYLEKEYAFDIEIVDFNYNEIELTTTFIGDPLDYPEFCTYKSSIEFKCQFKNNVKWDECTEEGVCTEQTSKFDMKYEMKNGLIVANNTKFQYKGNTLDKKYTFGGNSTTITLQDPETENLEDTKTNADAPDTNYGDSYYIEVAGYDEFDPDNTDSRAYVKFNISSIPADKFLESVELQLWVWANGYDTGDIFKIDVHEYDDDTWVETLLTYNNAGVEGNLLDSLGGLDEDYDDIWLILDVTSWVETKYEGSDVNVSFVLMSFEVPMSTENDYLYFYSKDNVTEGTRPILEIVYSDFPPPQILDVNVQNPQGITLNDGNTVDGNYLVDFNITLKQNAEAHAKLYYSTVGNTFENFIVDINLLDGALNPTADFNCTPDVNFENPIECFYDFNFMEAADGTYYIDINAYIADGNSGKDTGTVFTIDFIIPPPPPPVSPLIYYDSFEAGVDMNWVQEATGDDCEYIRDDDGTPSSGTGSCEGASGAGCTYPAGAKFTVWYLFIETSTGQPCATAGYEAWLVSPTIDFDAYTDMSLDVNINMYGTNIGTLTIDENTSGSWVNLYTISTDQGAAWFNQDQNLNDITGVGSLRISAVYGGGWAGDIVIDEIAIRGEDYVPPPEDSCTCPESGNWVIIEGDVCTLTTLCDITGSNLYVEDGSLTLTSTATLVADKVFWNLITGRIFYDFLGAIIKINW